LYFQYLTFANGAALVDRPKNWLGVLTLCNKFSALQWIIVKHSPRWAPKEYTGKSRLMLGEREVGGERMTF
jgi:hypothetical protein